MTVTTHSTIINPTTVSATVSVSTTQTETTTTTSFATATANPVTLSNTKRIYSGTGCRLYQDWTDVLEVSESYDSVLAQCDAFCLSILHFMI